MDKAHLNSKPLGLPVIVDVTKQPTPIAISCKELDSAHSRIPNTSRVTT